MDHSTEGLDSATTESTKGTMPTLNEIATALRQMKDAVSHTPHEEKSAFAYVQRVKPEFVNDDHMMGFLKAEAYDANVSVIK